MIRAVNYPAMARNPKNGKPHASKLRWGDWSAKELREAADNLRNVAGFLDGLAKEFDALGVKSLRVDGDKKYSAATKLMSEFGGNIQKALIDFQTRRN